MAFIHSPPVKGREIEMLGIPQESGKIIDPTEFTINEIKEILKGEGLPEKGKVKADYVQRLQEHAVGMGDENYTFVVKKYPHIARRNSTTVDIGNDERKGNSVSDDRVETVKPATNMESRMGNMESEVSQIGKVLEKVVSVMTDVQARLSPQNQPAQVSNTEASVPPPTI